MAFKLLDSKHADTELRRLAVDRLAELPMCDLRLYILQLVQVSKSPGFLPVHLPSTGHCRPPLQALKFEWRHDSPLARLLLRTALTNKHFGNLLFW